MGRRRAAPFAYGEVCCEYIASTGMNPYSTPRYAEREAAHQAMLKLDRLQQAVLRSYVLQVHFGGKSLAEWHGSEFAVNKANWHKPYRKGGRYYGTEDDGNPEFRAALEKLVECYTLARTVEEERVVAEAGRLYRLAATEAARTHIDLMRGSEDDAVMLKAASEIADRAGVLAPKRVEMRVESQTRTYSVIAHPGQWDEDDEQA